MYHQTDWNGSHRQQRVTEVAKSRLQASPYLPLAKVTCDYEDGVLLLRGRLPDFYHKQLAQHAVAEVAKSRLQASPYLPLAKVTCDYEDGVLLLRGRLPDFYHKQLSTIPGVTQVVNDTEVASVVA